jgi:hypothetical protein
MIDKNITLSESTPLWRKSGQGKCPYTFGCCLGLLRQENALWVMELKLAFKKPKQR